MQKRFPFLAMLMAVAVMFCLTPISKADTITAGTPTSSTSNLNASSPNDLPVGVVALATISGNFAGAATGTPSGTYTASVYNNAAGGLDFVYTFSNTGTTNFVDSVTASNFAGFTTDVFATGSGNAPVSASSTGNASLDVIKFYYSNSTSNNDVNPGQSSETLVIATNATSYYQGVFTLQDGDTASVAAFQPVPEPGSMLLFGTGLSGVAAALRRRIAK